MHDCTWRGTIPDCDDAKCKSDEVAIAINGVGETGLTGCFCMSSPTPILLACDLLISSIGGRKKTNCCKISKPSPPQLHCNVTSCNIINNLCEDTLNTVDALSRRDKTGQDLHSLEKRGNPRDFRWMLTSGLILTEVSRYYPGPTAYMDRLQRNLQGLARRWFDIRSRTCGTPRLHQVNIDVDGPPPAMSNTEHAVPVRAHFL